MQCMNNTIHIYVLFMNRYARFGEIVSAHYRNRFFSPSCKIEKRDNKSFLI